MWQYAQSSGLLTSADGLCCFHGYSGFGIAKNDPGAQEFPDQGPIPVGYYTISLITDAEGQPCDYKDARGITLKRPVMRLLPDSANEMYGRSGFLIHGDSIDHPGTASHGCIITSHVAREQVWASGDHALQVVTGLHNNREAVQDATAGEN